MKTPLVFWISSLSLSLLLVARLSPAEPPTETTPRIREPAVAGLFYPKANPELAQTIDALLAAAKTLPSGELKALITPHAGYAYSGPVAANAFRLLTGLHYKTVLVMGPSHYASMSAASVSGADLFRTPLGDVPISPQARVLGKRSPFVTEARADVERPAWWRQSSRAEPLVGHEKADTWEHSVEVEVPFLQKTLGSFSLIPVVMGEVDPAEAARALQPLLQDDWLVIASSDLSHYHSYAEAKLLDQRCVDAILTLDTTRMANQEACGKNPILTLLYLAKERGWKPRLLDLRNSGDVAGDKTRVVGYAAIAFFAQPPAEVDAYSAAERRSLLTLAREAVRAAAAGGGTPRVEIGALTARLQESRGSFVTLTMKGELRGCIGHLDAKQPLFQDVLGNARAAALEDPRFPPVTAKEVDRLEIEVSVLTPPQPLLFNSPEDLLRKLQPHRDGVVLQIGDRLATYLPQVWEQITDKGEFLNTLSAKAGCAPNAWRGPHTAVAIYQVESFKESELRK